VHLLVCVFMVFNSTKVQL